jgi:eukaryotic-like serine/threonine-protein kinase
MDSDDEPVLEIESVIRSAERFGKYRSLGRIGQGGMADVFLAVGRGPAGFNKLVVIKRLRDSVASDAAFRDMFLDEARLAARLNHPNVVQTYEVFEDEGAFLITMEYLEGQPLGRIARECAKRGLRLEPRICARIISDALCGLQYAHEACDYDGVPLQIVHRDVSPQNIFVTYAGQVKVVDFGIAKAERSQTKTQAGFLKGKAAYMAPEQLEGGPIDRRVDIFTTGIVLWELLAGKKLMAAESTAKTLMRLLRDPVPLLSEVLGSIDPALERIADRALQRDPAMRFQSASEMRDELEQYLTETRQPVRHEEIGRIVGEVFSGVREELKRQISDHMAITSEYPPRSGSMPAVLQLQALAHPSGTQALDLAQTGMSGISVSGLAVSQTTGSQLMPQMQTQAGPLLVAPPVKGPRVPSWAVAVIAAVSVGLVFTLFERMRSMSLTSSTPVPAALAPSQAATYAGPPSPVSPAQTAVLEPIRVDPATPSAAGASTPAVTRPSPPSFVWHPARSQPPEPRQTAQPTRPAALSAAVPLPASQANAPAGATVSAEPPLAHVAVSPSAVAPPVPSAPATQEGRKFRTSL